MNNIALAVFVVAIGVISAHDTNPKLQQCKRKFLEQAQHISFDSLPRCFDAGKLDQAKRHVRIFGHFFHGLPKDCKKPSQENIKKCLDYSYSYFLDHTKEVQAGLVNSINSLFDGSKQCIDEAVKQFSELDQYIINGCV